MITTWALISDAPLSPASNLLDTTMEAELLIADVQLRRFIRTQYQNNLGYPTVASFARIIGRGCISLPPTPEDPVLDCVGGFFHGLRPIEKRAITDYYAKPNKNIRICAKRIGISKNRFHRMLRRVLWGCRDWLVAAGFA